MLYFKMITSLKPGSQERRRRTHTMFHITSQMKHRGHGDVFKCFESTFSINIWSVEYLNTFKMLNIFV